MPYAAEGCISHDPIDGGVEITEAQYAEGLAAMLEGRQISIAGGFHVAEPPAPAEPDHEPEIPVATRLLQWLRQECDRRLALLRQDYPDSEVLSWDKQEAEARAGGGPLVAALAAARGLDEQELIRRILAKAESFAVISGTIIGQRQALEDQVRAGALEVEWPEVGLPAQS